MKNIQKLISQKPILTYLFWILFSLLIFSFVCQVAYSYLDPDLGWHLKIGQDIWQTKSVPKINYYNYTIFKAKWVDHEWLANVLMYWLYIKYEYWPLTVGFSLIIVLLFWLQFWLIKKYYTANKKALFLLPILWLVGLRAAAPHLGVRVQEIALLNLTLLILIIAKYEKYKKTKTLAWLIPLFVFWANVHGSFLIGLFILFFWVSIKLTELKLKNTLSAKKYFSFLNFDNTLNKKQIITISFFSILGFFSTFLTPYGYKLYSFLTTYQNTYYLNHIEEWLPVYALPIQYWQILYSALVLAIIIVNLILFSLNQKAKHQLNLKDIGFSLFFLFLAFKSKRNFPLFWVISLPFLIKYFSIILDTPQTLKKIFQDKFLSLFLQTTTLVVIPLLIVLNLANLNLIQNPFTSFCSKYPCQAVNFLKNNPQLKNKRLFARFGWGGYLLWTWPGKQLFIDGRLPQYPFAGHTLLEEYYEFFKESLGEQKLNQYKIKVVLLPSSAKSHHLNWFEKYILGLDEKKLNKQKNYLLDFLSSSPKWKQIYNDNTSLIYYGK